jgi:hypothetical protein
MIIFLCGSVALRGKSISRQDAKAQRGYEKILNDYFSLRLCGFA